jgi:hypothetical protein
MMWGLYKDRQIKSDQYGYSNFGDENDIGVDRFFRGSLDAPRDYVRCAKAAGAPYPSCQRIIGLSNEIVITYSLSRDYLPMMSDVDSEIVGFMNKFRIAGPSLEFIE